MPSGLELDASQRAVLALPPSQTAVVVGAPGSGKTTTLIELAASRVEVDGISPDEVMVIAASRRSAAALRDRIGLRLARVTTGPLARTASSVAFEAVTARAQSEGAPAPALLSGADQDMIIRELLDGHRDGSGPHWPEHLDPSVRSLSIFRTELRELMMRATEYGVDAASLRALAARHARPEWAAAADFTDEYQAVVASARSDRLDPAELMAFAERAVADGLAGERLAGVRLILVDELQQATEGTVRLIAAFAERGSTVVGFGDPDIAANSFRGGETGIVARFGTRLGAAAVPQLVLSGVHRHGPQIRGVVREVTGRIGAAGEGTQRAAEAVENRQDAASPAEPIRKIVAPSPAPQHRSIARQLRERHLLNGVPWGEMAVIARSGSEVASLARALATSQVPVRTLIAGRAVRDELAAGALLRLITVSIEREPLDGVVAGELLTGPFGRLDAITVRRLRLALRAEELAGGGTRRADELLADAMRSPSRLATIDHGVAKQADRLARLIDAIRRSHAGGDSAEELLWTAWDGAGVAEEWRRQALGAGMAADEANRALDGIVALFTAARRFVERKPDGTSDQFLDEILDAEVPEDTLAPQSDGDAVLVVTPSGAAGFEFDTVVVAGLQDGQWPNLRVRGSLLGAPQLVAALDGRLGAAVDERREVLSDELRLFALAVSRARRLLILAVLDSDDETPSPFFELVAPAAAAVRADIHPLTLRGLTGRLRRVLTTVSVEDGADRGDRVLGGYSERDRTAAASALAAFRDERVAGAEPSRWHGVADISTDAPLWDLADAEVRIPVSPSRLEEIERSPMEAFVKQVSGGGSGLAANVGTLIHDVLEHAVSFEIEALDAALEARWGELDFEASWQADVQRAAARYAMTALSGYLRRFEAEAAVLVSSEGDFRLDLAPAVMTGKIDRVESREGAIVIVDLKTGSVKSQREADEHPQLGAYQVAYADGAIASLPDGHRPGGAALLFTKKGTAKTPYTLRVQEAFDEEQLEEFRARVRRAALRMVGPILQAAVIDDPYAYGGDVRRVHLPGEVSGD